MNEWINVKDRLPDKAGWYLVWAPKYHGGSSHSREQIENGYMFVKFRPNYKCPWAIESSWQKDLVEYWMPLPPIDSDAKPKNCDKFDNDVAAVEYFCNKTGLVVKWSPELEAFLKWLFSKDDAEKYC